MTFSSALRPLAAGCFFLLAPLTARADAKAMAAPQFELATRYLKEGKPAHAARAFELASQLQPHGFAMLSAARAWLEAGQPAQAAEDFERAAQIGGLTPEQQTEANGSLEQVKRSIGTLLLRPPAGTSVAVQVDGAAARPGPATFYVEPGTHVVTVWTADGPKSDTVTVAKGESLSVDLPKKAAEPARAVTGIATSPSPRAETSLLPTVGVAAIGLGIGLVGAGAAFGLSAKSGKNAFDAAPSEGIADHTETLETLSTVGFVAGSALVAAGIVTLVLPTRTVRMTAGVNRITVVARF